MTNVRDFALKKLLGNKTAKSEPKPSKTSITSRVKGAVKKVLKKKK